MALRMVSRFYRTYVDAVHAVADLAAAGVPDADISLIESEDDARLPPGVTADAAQPPARAGATIGAGIGGGLGVLVGVGAIASKVLAPLAALGWLVPTILGALAGAALGALIGKVTKLGGFNRQAHSFAAGLERGEHLVMVQIDEQQVAQIEAILARSYPAPPPPVPDEPVTSIEETRAAIHREEERLQYE